MRKNLKIKIFGGVQGIGFRYEAKAKADELVLKGFVRNERDGSVYAEAEGEEENLHKFLAWCRTGPLFAEVKKVDFRFSAELKDFPDFRIVHWGEGEP